MEATAKKEVRKFGIRDKLSYAMGDFGCNMSFALSGTITTFYTMYVGLSTEIMAILIILLKIWDGINDPIMGSIMDRFRPKPGGSKFKPFILWGSIALVVSGAMVFLPIKGADTWVKIVVCVIGYLVWDTAYTVVNVPYGSMANVITDVPEERASLSMWRSVGAMIAQLPVMVLLPMIMYRDLTDSNGNIVYNPYITDKQEPIEVLIGENVFITALIMGVLGLVAFMILIKFTTERIKPEETLGNTKKEKVNYLQVIKSFLKNKAAISITIASIFQLIMMSGLQVATNALYKDFFHMGSESGIFMLASYLPLIGAMPLIVPLVKKYGKKEAASWPLLFGVLGGFLMFVLPESLLLGKGGIVIWIVLQFLVSLSFAVFATVVWAMVADCIDYQELQTGRREEGTVYAVYSLGRKIAQGLGAAMVLLFLGWIGFQEAGYDKNLGVEIPCVQTPEVANRIRILIGVIYCVCSIIQFVLLRFVYPLSKDKVDEMNVKLGRVNAVQVFNNED